MINKNKQDNQKNKTKHSTTGHSWDEISEYNIPTPRWWLIVWVICIIWALIYWFFYPAWPTISGNSKGSLNWSKFSQLQEAQKKVDEKKQQYLQQINSSSFSEIKQNQQLMQFVLNAGKSAFYENCSACHGRGHQGGFGYPNLNDDDWLWGGKVEDIYQTLLYGIRSGHEKARINQMPSFGLDGVLKSHEIKDVASFVRSLSGLEKTNENGAKIFANNCVACHGAQGKGNQQLGAPNLTDKIWLYYSDANEVYKTIYYSRAGVMPFWQGRLDDNTIKILSIYIHSLGGGVQQ
ncbi:MAG: cytochrome-c oxidase, cbb3-type subunit III [Proteobacteria bacterium]|nr:cytochrome-c oxidase, cbb3-type subunit III [Pseudomonadota bacterium]